MKRISCLTIYAIAAALTLGPQALQAKDDKDEQKPKSTSNKAAKQALSDIERANRLIGKNVRTSDNDRIGTIEDFVVDFTSGRVLYAVVDTKDQGKVAVAPGVFTSAKGDTLRTSAAKEKFEDAPEFTSDIDEPGEISKADFVSRVYRHYGQQEWWQGPNAPANQGSFENVHKTSELRGMDVHNVNGDKIADVNNTVIDLPAGRVAYVVLSPDQDLKLGDNLYALPPDALTPNRDGKSLTSNIDREKLAAAPHFSKDNWDRLSNPQWASRVYQHYGKQPYFTSGATLEPTGRDTED